MARRKLGLDLTSLRLKHSVEVNVGRGTRDPYFLFGKNAYRFNRSRTSRFRKFRRAGMQNDLKLLPKMAADYALFQTEALELNLFFVPLEKRRSLKSSQVAESIDAALAMWKPLVQMHPFFKVIRDNPKAFAYYLLEQSYFVSCAENYISAGARAARSSRIGKILTSLAREEKDHYVKLIEALGVPEAVFRMHDPNASTQALVAHLFQLATTDPESFLFSLSLFETDPDEIDMVERFYSQHSDRVVFDSSAFIDHHREDIELGHVSLWKEHLNTIPNVSSERASKFIGDLHMTKHMLELWFDGIVHASQFLDTHGSSRARIRVTDFIRPKPQWGSV